MSYPTQLLMALSPELLCLLAAAFCVIFSWRRELKPGLYRDMGRLACLGGLATSILTFVYFRAHGTNSNIAAFSFGISLDRFSETLTVMVLIFSFLVLTIATARIEAFRPNMGFFYVFILTATAAAAAIALSQEMVSSWLLLQLLVVSVVSVTGLLKIDINALKSALRQLLVAGFSSLLVGLGFAFLYSATGVTASPAMPQHGTSHLLILMGTTLVSLGALAFMGQAVLPWISSRSVEDAPSPVETMVQGLFMVAGVALLIRFVFPFMAVQGLPAVLTLVGSATVLLSAFLAWTRRDFRAQVAWFFMMQAGFVLLSLLALKAEGLELMLLQLASMLICVATVGAAVALLVDDDISGLWHHHSGIAFCLLVGGIALAGLPPSIGFFAHWMLISELLGLGYGWVAVVVVVASVLAALIPLRWIMEMGSFREGEVQVIDVKQPRWVMFSGAALSLFGGLGLGPLMGALFDIARGVSPA